MIASTNTDEWVSIAVYFLVVFATGWFIEKSYQGKFRRNPAPVLLWVCSMLWPIFWTMVMVIAIAWVISELD